MNTSRKSPKDNQRLRIPPPPTHTQRPTDKEMKINHSPIPLEEAQGWLVWGGRFFFLGFSVMCRSQECNLATCPKRFKKRSFHLTYFLLPGIYLNELITRRLRDPSSRMFTVAFFTMVEMWGRHKSPTFEDWGNKWNPRQPLRLRL